MLAVFGEQQCDLESKLVKPVAMAPSGVCFHAGIRAVAGVTPEDLTGYACLWRSED